MVSNIYHSNKLNVVGTGSVRGAVIDHIMSWVYDAELPGVSYMPFVSEISWRFGDPHTALMFKIKWF